MARFTRANARQRLEALGITCIPHDIFASYDDLRHDFDFVFHSALPLQRNEAFGVTLFGVPPLERWPNSYDSYADATGRLMAHVTGVKGFVFASSISVYDPPGGDAPVPEARPFGIHATADYSFTKVGNEAVVSYLSRSLDIPTTILRVGSASGVDGGPMRDRLDQLVRGDAILVHPDKPTYVRPIFEPDCARLAVAALESGRVPPLVVNWCGDEVVTVEEYCTFMGQLIGSEPIFDYTEATFRSLVPDVTFMHEVLGHCEVTWQQGCRMLVEQCYPELLKSN
jgi:nucleoside-diphosphate-sugar epimerase